MSSVRVATHPRIGLLGNPSDGYAGRVVAFTFSNFVARVEIETSKTCRIEAPDGSGFSAPDMNALSTTATPRDRDGLGMLVAAAIVRLVDHLDERFPDVATRLRRDAALRFRLRVETDIPRQAGLSGSSAVIIATLRAMLARLDFDLPNDVVATLALESETKVLGIAAGPQDRVVQSFGGLLAMDFGTTSTKTPHRIELDADSLPPLLLAYGKAPGRSSGATHEPLRRRWERGDESVRSVMTRLTEIALEGQTALETSDHDRLRELMNENFDLRTRIQPIDARDREMITIARQHGAGAKFCGSGGAVVALPETKSATTTTSVRQLEQAWRAAGFEVVVPTLVVDSPRIVAPRSNTSEIRTS